MSKATRQIKRGKIDEAIKSYLDLLNLDHNDVRVLLKLAELFNKNSQPDKALRYYLDAAKQYTRSGFFERAIAVYKQALRLDASHKEAHQNMAELLVRLNQPWAALETYKNLVLLQERDGQLWEAIEVAEKMRNLAPENQIIVAKLADLYFKNGMKTNGYKVIKPIIDLLKGRGDDEQYLKFLLKVSDEDPQNHENLRELADFYLEHGVTEKAYEIMVKLNRLLPDDHDLMRLTADLALELGRPEQSVDRLKDLKDWYEKKGLKHRARTAAREILTIMPEDEDARAEVGEDSIIIEVEEGSEPDDHADVMLGGGADEEQLEHIEVIPGSESETLLPPAVPVRDLPNYLERVSLNLRFGVGAEAFLLLKLDLTPDGRDLNASLRLKDVHRESGINDQAVREFEQAIKEALAAYDFCSAREMMARMLGYEPAAPCALETGTGPDEPARSWSEDQVTVIEDQKVDSFEARLLEGEDKDEVSPPESSLDDDLAPPEGYELDDTIQKLIEFYGAKFKAGASMELSKDERELLDHGLAGRDETAPSATAPDPAPDPEDEDQLDPPEGYQLDPYVQDLLRECAAQASAPGQSAAAKPPGAEADGGPGVAEVAVFCPFGPLTDLLTETPGAVRQEGVLELAALHTLTYNGRNVSLVGPAEDAAAAFSEMLEAGARRIIILDLADRSEGSQAGDLILIRPAGPDNDSLSGALVCASQNRRLEHRLVQTDPALSPDRQPPALMNLDLAQIIARAKSRGASLTGLIITADNLDQIRRERELPSNRVFTTAWRAGYVALDAAFSLAGPGHGIN